VFTSPEINNNPLTRDIPVTVGENLVFIVYLATFLLTEKYMVLNELATATNKLKTE
jgi:hypothetical protein